MTTYRTTSRHVTFEIALSGEPVIYQYAPDSHRLLVESVRLRFDRTDDEYCVSALLCGPTLLRNGKPGKTRIEENTSYVFERWPTWLQRLADEHRPERTWQHWGPLT